MAKDEMTITLPDGSKKTFPKGSTSGDVAKSIGSRLADAALAAKFDDQPVDLFRKLESDGKLQILTFDSPEGKEVFWHSSAHLLAQAVLEIFPETKITIGPAIEAGFYYDFDRNHTFTPEDLQKIEKRMLEIAKKNLVVSRTELSAKDALVNFGKNPYKKELIEEFVAKKLPLSSYTQGDFTDLCRGPHIPNVGAIKAVKLTKVSGAYWRGDAKNKQLQRVYGITFPKQAMLDDYLKMLEEAEKRDHRKLGQLLDLFSFQDEAKGMPFWHPNGMILINELTGFIRSELAKLNYKEIKTPIMLNKSLWERSGHWSHYKQNMYITKVDNEEHAIKPMNCPGAILVYKTRYRSYKELPLKLAEFGLDHRHELSGVLSGLTRVRAFTQDDAHIFCTQEQIEEQVAELIAFGTKFYSMFGFQYGLELSTRPDDSMGDDSLWEQAEGALKNVLDAKKIPYKINAGDGAFYGPKIDFHIKDALGRSWQLCTIQLDFQMPEKFDLKYMADDGTNKHRPVMIHRAIMGSLERFVALLLEHFAGHLPLWLNPEQARVLTVSEKNTSYAKQIVQQLKDSGIRAEIDDSGQSVSYKVREAQIHKVNYILVVGDKEQQEDSINVRTRKNEVLGAKKIADVIREMQQEIEQRTVK